MSAVHSRLRTPNEMLLYWRTPVLQRKNSFSGIPKERFLPGIDRIVIMNILTGYDDITILELMEYGKSDRLKDAKFDFVAGFVDIETLFLTGNF